MRHLLAVLGAICALAAAGPAAAYPWPLKPFDAAHPVRANFGDPRTVFWDQPPDGILGPGSFSFHDGIDISADAGTPVYPVEDGRVHLVSATGVAVRTRHAEFRYIHIVPAVLEGQRVVRGETILGFVQAWAGHLHFGEIRGGRTVNPLRRGHLQPYFDHTRPRVTELIARDAAGRTLDRPLVLCGTVALVAAAEDPTSLPVPGAWAGLPVSPAVVVWTMRSSTGAVVDRGLVTDFLRPLPPRSRFWSIYARGTFQNAARFGRTQLLRLNGNFLYSLAPSFDTRKLANGTYEIRVTAQDARGNQGALSTAVTVSNGPAGCAA